jgi:hypothetical protein
MYGNFSSGDFVQNNYFESQNMLIRSCDLISIIFLKINTNSQEMKYIWLFIYLYTGQAPSVGNERVKCSQLLECFACISLCTRSFLKHCGMHGVCVPVCFLKTKNVDSCTKY